MTDAPNAFSANDPAGLAAASLRSPVWATPPAVARLRTDVRSGENFLIATSGNLPPLFIGPVVIEWGFEVQRESSGAFHAWLTANETNLAAECPAGVAYRGTYGVFAQSNDSLGGYRTVWSFDSLAALEPLSSEVANATGFAKRMQELTAFRDERIGASRSQQIYHPAATATRT